MEFQQISIKTFLSFLFIGVFVSVFGSNTEPPILHEITIENTRLISVKVYAPDYIQENCIFSFQNSTPNYYLIENNIKNLRNFKVVLKNGEIIEKEAAANISIKEDFDFIAYQFLVEKIDSTSFIPIKNVLTGNAFINFSSFLGSFSTDTLNEIRVKVFKNKKRIYSASNQFSFFVQNPLCLCASEVLPIGNNEILVQVNDTNLIDFSSLKKMVLESFSALSEYTFLDNIKDRKLIFLFDKTSQKSGAISRKENIVFHFNTQDPYVIQKTILHELFHWIVPVQESWLDEAVPEYLAIKTMMQNKVISEEKFLKVLSQKIKLIDDFKNFDLREIYDNSSLYKALYSKGTVYAWMQDLLILEVSGFEYGIEDYILNLNGLPQEKMQLLIQELIDFNKQFIENNGNISFNQYLNKIGVLYERNKLVEIKEKQKLTLTNNGNLLVISDPANLSCLQKDDIIFSLDGKKNANDIRDKLLSLSDKSSNITVIRESKKFRYKLDNQKSIMQKIPHRLSFVLEPNVAQKINWVKFAKNSN